MRLPAPCLELNASFKTVVGSRTLSPVKYKNSALDSSYRLSVTVNRGFSLFLDSGSYQTQPLPSNTAYTLHKLVDLTPKSAFLELSSEQTNNSL